MLYKKFNKGERRALATRPQAGVAATAVERKGGGTLHTIIYFHTFTALL